MSANRLLLVCKHCHVQGSGQETAFCIGERAGNESPYAASSTKRLDDWFLKHSVCGPVDSVALAYGRTPNWDQPELASKTASAVRIALVNGESH